MTGLREAVARIAAAGALPHPPAGRQLQTERVVAKLAAAAGGGGRDGGEDWTTIAARLDFDRLENARPRDVRRAIADIWADDTRHAQAAPLVGYGLATERKSYDRALLLAYLRRFPRDHPVFGALADAARVAAERHDWPWRERGRGWALWDPERGPERIGGALLVRDDPAELLAAIGLDGDLAQGAFALDAVKAVCDTVGRATGAEAKRLGTRLIALFDRLEVRALNGALAYALLNPWTGGKPSRDHRRRVGGLLVKRIGDPRLNRSAWSVLGVPDELIAALRAWLTEASVRGFFKIVGRTTKDPRQWAEREAFWLGYLDAGVIGDAWFAFGVEAERLARSLAEKEGVEYGLIPKGTHADPGHSSLLMSIGTLRVAEWSHSGACRFWRADDAGAPALYLRRYPGEKLRAMFGGPDFERLSHNGAWQRKFAHKVHEQTGRTHPLYGGGHRWQGY